MHAAYHASAFSMILTAASRGSFVMNQIFKVYIFQCTVAERGCSVGETCVEAGKEMGN